MYAMADKIPSATTVLSAYTAFAASIMVVKTMASEVENIACQIIPQSIREKIVSKIRKLFLGYNSLETVTLTIDEKCDGLTANQVYEASEMYLRSKITPSNKRLKVSKAPRDKEIAVTVNNGEEINDFFEGIKLKWMMVVQQKGNDNHSHEKETRSIELSFAKEHKDKVLESYIPFVLDTAKRIQEEKRVVKLYRLGYYALGNSDSINLKHPSTFDTLAMDPEAKKAIIDDLDRFVKRREFYRRVGKVWKRGYLLYGPPGTGKSSLVAAMANYLKFHIYDFELSSLRSGDFRQMLVSTANRSIIVIEDIDCSAKLQNRQYDDYFTDDDEEHIKPPPRRNTTNEKALPLAGLLNFVDGLWSSCGDERIIVFTTNHIEKLDPALLRAGRMDMHIHMSYLTFGGFKVLASNYLNTCNHPLFPKIEELLGKLQVTPAMAAEELMRSEDVNEALEGFLQGLQSRKQTGDDAGEEGYMSNPDERKRKRA